MNKKKICVSFIILIFILSFNSVFSLDIALTPGSIDFGTVLREGFAQDDFKFTTASNSPILVNLYHTDPNSELNDWIYMQHPNGSEIRVGETLEVRKDKPLKIIISFEPPSDAPNGDYATNVGATVEGALDSSAREGDTVAKIKTGVSIKIKAKIDDVEKISCLASDMSVSSPEIGEPLSFTTRMKNTGNVVIDPDVKIIIFDELKTREIKTVDGNLGKIKPTILDNAQFDIESMDLPPGKYVASVNIDTCNIENRLINFRVLDVGSKSFDGRIKSINVDEVIYGINSIPLKVLFENLGETSTVARFSGGIYKEGILIQNLNSERITVGASEIVELDIGTFTPVETRDKEERYVLRGKVYYGNKQTKEYSKVFFVDKTDNFNFSTQLLILVIIGIIILVLGKKVVDKRNQR